MHRQAAFHFVPKDNLMEVYKLRGPPELIRQWVEEARAKQLDEHGKPKRAAEIAVCNILDRHGATTSRNTSFTSRTHISSPTNSCRRTSLGSKKMAWSMIPRSTAGAMPGC